MLLKDFWSNSIDRLYLVLSLTPISILEQTCDLSDVKSRCLRVFSLVKVSALTRENTFNISLLLHNRTDLIQRLSSGSAVYDLRHYAGLIGAGCFQRLANDQRLWTYLGVKVEANYFFALWSCLLFIKRLRINWLLTDQDWARIRQCEGPRVNRSWWRAVALVSLFAGVVVHGVSTACLLFIKRVFRFIQICEIAEKLSLLFIVSKNYLSSIHRRALRFA